MKHFHYPVQIEHAQEFCHPDPASDASLPFLYQRKDGRQQVGTYNTHIALLIDTVLPVERLPSAELEKVYDGLPFDFIDEHFAKHPDQYAPLDNARGGLWKGGELPQWKHQGGKYTYNHSRFVIVGRGCIVPKCALQLVSKLPRVHLCKELAGGNLSFTFNGGRGLIKGVYTRKSRLTKHHIFQSEELKRLTRGH